MISPVPVHCFSITSQMLHATFRGNRLNGSGEIFLKGFRHNDMGMATILDLHVTTSIMLLNFNFLVPYIQNLVQNGPLVSEKTPFNFYM